MASNEISILVTGKDEASSTFASIKQNAGGMGEALGKVGQIAGGIILSQGILKAPDFLMGAAQAAADDEQSTIKLKTAVDNTGQSYDKYKDQLDATIEAAQRKGFTDDEARDALALLMAQTGDATEAQKRFTLAQDLSRGSGVDLATASRLLGKVTEENANVFKKMGINLKAGSTEAEAFGAIQEKFGGQSEAFANSTAGSYAALKIQMSELKEKIGYQLLPVMAALGTVLVEDVIPALNKAADWIELHIKPAVEEFVQSQVIPTLKDAFAQLKQTIDGLMPIAKQIAKWFKDNPEAIAAVGIALGILLVALFPIPIAIIAIITAGTLLLAHWDDIRTEIDKQIAKYEAFKDKMLELPLVGPILQAFFDGLVLMVKAAWEDIQARFQLAIDFIEGIIKLGTDLWHGDFSKFWDDLKALVGTMFDDLKAIFSIQLGLIKDLIETALKAWVQVQLDAAVLFLDAGKALLQALYDGASDLVTNILLPWFTGLPGQLRDTLGDLGTWLWQKGADLLTGLKDGMVSGAESMWAYIRGLPGWIVDLLGDLSSLLYNIGSSIIQGLLDGIVDSTYGKLKSFVGKIGGLLTGWKGPPAADLQLLYENGTLIMAGLQRGLSDGLDGVKDFLGGAGSGIKDALGGAGGGQRGGAHTSAGSYRGGASGRISGGTGGITLVYAPTFSTASPAEAQKFLGWLMPQIRRELAR